jgi:hypothetical protein
VKRFVIFGIVFAVILGCWWFSPGQVLRRRTTDLLSTLTMDAASSSTSRQMGGYSLNALLASQVILENPILEEAQGTFERSEIESAYSWLASQSKQTRFHSSSFRAVKVEGDTGYVDLFLEALVELPNYRPVDGKFDARLVWRKGDDGWRLTKATWSPVSN